MEKTGDLVLDTFSENGLLANAIPNYKERPQQIQLAQKIQTSIEKGEHLLAEAPTGVGKSLAALVPAFEHIKKTDEPVIIVTSSIILQEQYINKDIPLLEKLYDMDVSPVLIKGRNNYTCPKKVQDARNGKLSATTSAIAQEAEEVLRWAISTESGDKSELSFVPHYQTWAQFSCVDRNECTGKQCPFYSICPYYKERSKVKSSKLVVCNYHYFFTAQESEAPMLPTGAKVVVFDEGHEMNAIARDFQEKSYTYNSLRTQIDLFLNAIDKIQYSSDISYPSKLVDEMELDLVNATLNKLFFDLSTEYQEEQRTRKSYLLMEIPTRTRLQTKANAHLDALISAAEAAYSYLDRFGFSFENLPAMMDYYDEGVLDWFVVVHNTASHFEEKALLLKFIFAFNKEQNDGNFIFWLQPYKEAVSIHAKPLDGSGLVTQLFVKGEKVSIVMSATLAANRQFDHLKHTFGIGDDKSEYPVGEIIVSSPFDLENNLLWYLPYDAPAGNEREHTSFVLEQMEEMILAMKGRCLCLFTSKRNVQEAETYLGNRLPEEIKIVSQEKMPKQKIIDFVKENDNAVILGTKSFFTGIDIQGHHISAVLVDKLPYPMIGNPVNDYLMNEPRGFYKFSLPEAIISMKQAFGRLNRTTTDKGIVAVYDGRLSTARYKNKIFNSFDFIISATKNWDVVERYIKKMELP